MATETIRQTFEVPPTWADLTSTLVAAKNKSGFIKHIRGMPVEVIKGGAAAPNENQEGTPLVAGSEEWCEASNIWLRCRSRRGASVMFVATE